MNGLCINFTTVFLVGTLQISLKLSYYAGIMFNTFANLNYAGRIGAILVQMEAKSLYFCTCPFMNEARAFNSSVPRSIPLACL